MFRNASHLGAFFVGKVVAAVGLEPTRPKASDFKSGLSTSSSKRPQGLPRGKFPAPQAAKARSIPYIQNSPRPEYERGEGLD